MPEGAIWRSGQQGSTGTLGYATFLRMGRLRTLTLLLALATGCVVAPPPVPVPAEHSLSGLAAQHVAVLPTYIARIQPPLDWAIGRPAELQRTLDAEIASAFDERGLKRQWIFPDQLSDGFKRNQPYATDPYALAEESLRAPTLAVDTRLPEPLASQIRTLVALYSDVRYVLAPVELRVEQVKPKGGRGVLRAVLLDARASNVRWVGDVPSDNLESFSPALAASIAAHLADVVVPR